MSNKEMITPKIINISQNKLLKKILTPRLLNLNRIFLKYNHDIRICGGAVRDILIDRLPNDIDFATEATVDQMLKMFKTENIRTFNNNGHEHGTVTARLDDEENFEITTLRIDKKTDGRHAKVEFVSDWSLDSLRRDLTINSMYLDFDGNIIDYYNGYEDLLKRNIRFVGNAEDRIREDYLRILRYFRYLGSTENPKNHESEILNIIKANAHGLDKISVERIFTEFSKILLHSSAPYILELMDSTNTLNHMRLPLPLRLDNFREIHSLTYDLKPDIGTLLAALLPNDITDPKDLLSMKQSKLVMNLICFINSNFSEFSQMDSKKRKIFIQRQLLLIQGSQLETMKFKCREICKYFHDTESLEFIDSFICPKLPLDVTNVAEMLCKKELRRLKNIIKSVMDDWILSNYEISQKQLYEKAKEYVETKSERIYD